MASPIPAWNNGAVNPRNSDRTSVGTWTSACTGRYVPSVFTFNANWAPRPLRCLSTNGTGVGARMSASGSRPSSSALGPMSRVMCDDCDQVERVSHLDLDFDSSSDSEGEVVNGDVIHNTEEESGSLNGALHAYLASYGFPDGLGYERPPPDEEAGCEDRPEVPTRASLASTILSAFGGELDWTLIDEPGRAWEAVCWSEIAPGSDSDSESESDDDDDDDDDVPTILNEEWLSLTGARAEAARATIVPSVSVSASASAAPHYGVSGYDRLVTLTVTSRDRDPPPYDLADHHLPPRARSQLSFPTSPTDSHVMDSSATHFSTLFPQPPHSAWNSDTPTPVSMPPPFPPHNRECSSSPPSLPHFPFYIQSQSIPTTCRRPLPPRPITSSASISAVAGPRATAEAWLSTSATGPYAAGTPSGAGPTHNVYSCLNPAALSDSRLDSADSDSQFRSRSQSHFDAGRDHLTVDVGDAPSHTLHHPTLLSSTPPLSEESTDSFVKLDVFTTDEPPKQILDGYNSGSKTAFQHMHVFPSSMILTSSTADRASGGIGLQPTPAPRKSGRRSNRGGTASAKSLHRLATRCTTLTRRIGIGVGAGSAGSARDR